MLPIILDWSLGVDSEILKRGDALCRPPWLADEENFRFQLKLYIFGKICLSAFSNFLHFYIQ